MGTHGDSSAPEHPLGGSGTRGDTATTVTLTEAEGLPPDPHHPPQLPCGAGQQEVTGEAEGDEAKCHPLSSVSPLSTQTHEQRDRQLQDGTYRFWVSASITMEM